MVMLVDNAAMQLCYRALMSLFLYFILVMIALGVHITLCMCSCTMGWVCVNVLKGGLIRALHRRKIKNYIMRDCEFDFNVFLVYFYFFKFNR